MYYILRYILPVVRVVVLQIVVASWLVAVFADVATLPWQLPQLKATGVESE